MNNYVQFRDKHVHLSNNFPIAKTNKIHLPVVNHLFEILGGTYPQFSLRHIDLHPKSKSYGLDLI